MVSSTRPSARALTNASSVRHSSTAATRLAAVVAAVLGLCLGIDLGTGNGVAFVLSSGLVQQTLGRLTAAPAMGRLRPTATVRHAEPFDPFGWKGKFKDTLQGFMDGMAEEEPSKLEEAMIVEIFDKFDSDKDGILDLDEFNTLQTATEGEEAVYTQDQLKQLLLAVNPDMEAPEEGMPFADYRNLYVKRRLRDAYITDVTRDHMKIFGPGGGNAAAKAAELEAQAAAGLTVGSAVTIEGLAGAVELNGKEGQLVSPVQSEAAMVAEGRVIVQLSDGERVALKPANVKAKVAPAVD